LRYLITTLKFCHVYCLHNWLRNAQRWKQRDISKKRSTTKRNSIFVGQNLHDDSNLARAIYTGYIRLCCFSMSM
jgi:hypothetical protein